MMDVNGRPMVLYHAGCADGFCAAWVARKKMPGAEFVAVSYGYPPPDVTGRDVYILDFSYKRPVLDQMAWDAEGIVVLDHHKTAQKDLADLEGGRDLGDLHSLYVHFDMNKSGARLTWDHFFPPDEPSPHWLVDYTEDRDLWRHALPYTKEVSAALSSYPFDFAVWDRLAEQGDPRSYPMGTGLTHHQLVSDGVAILRFKDQAVERACSQAYPITLDGHQILAVNTSLFVSEIAGKLAEGHPFGACWWIDGKHKHWSLRSRDGGVDVSEIAKAHGGGGHHNAAGFEENIT